MISAKKSLGQNWLNSASVRDLIVTTAKLSKNEVVLEIGPGTGFLTAGLLKTGAKVVAVEKDERLIPELEKRFAAEIKSEQLTLLINDILVDWPILASPHYKIVANIPYYLTGQILRHYLTAAYQPTSMTVMLQKEVAQRIMARDNKESLLSLAVRAYGQPHYIKTVPAGCFTPAPKVDSAILQIDQISRELFKASQVSEEKFWQLVHRGFSSKRKQLKNNLGCSTTALVKCKIKEQERAEKLTLENWLCLLNTII